MATNNHARPSAVLVRRNVDVPSFLDPPPTAVPGRDLVRVARHGARRDQRAVDAAVEVEPQRARVSPLPEVGRIERVGQEPRARVVVHLNQRWVSVDAPLRHAGDGARLVAAPAVLGRIERARRVADTGDGGGEDEVVGQRCERRVLLVRVVSIEVAEPQPPRDVDQAADLVVTDALPRRLQDHVASLVAGFVSHDVLCAERVLPPLVRRSLPTVDRTPSVPDPVVRRLLMLMPPSTGRALSQKAAARGGALISAITTGLPFRVRGSPFANRSDWSQSPTLIKNLGLRYRGLGCSSA